MLISRPRTNRSASSGAAVRSIVAAVEFSGVVPVAELVRNSGVRQLDGSADDLAGVVDEPHRRQRRDAFPGARFADESNGLAFADLQIDSVNRLHLSPFRRELGTDVRERK